MAGVTHINIQESVEELELLVRQQSNPRLKERLQALYLIKNQGISISAPWLRQIPAGAPKSWEKIEVQYKDG